MGIPEIKHFKVGDITTGYFNDEKKIATIKDNIKFKFNYYNHFECQVKDGVLHIRVFEGAMNIRPIASNCVEINPVSMFEEKQ